MKIPIGKTREEYNQYQKKWLQDGAEATITDEFLPLLENSPQTFNDVRHNNGWANVGMAEMIQCNGMQVVIQEVLGERGVHCTAIDNEYNNKHFNARALQTPERFVWPYYFFKTGIRFFGDTAIPETAHECLARGKLTGTLYHIIAEDEEQYYARQITSEEGYPFWNDDIFYGKKELFDCDIPQDYHIHIVDDALVITAIESL